MPPRNAHDRLGRRGLESFQVGGHPPWVVAIDVVGVEPVSHAAEATDVVHRVNVAGQPPVLDPLELTRFEAIFSEVGEFGVEQGTRLLPRLPGAERDDRAKRSGELAARLIGRHVLG